MNKRYVLITTQHRGVFAGELEEESGKIVTLTNARCAIYWGTKRGFLELADTGPTPSSKVGAVAPRIKLHDVTSIVDCTDAAADVWRRA